jgi:hypothetical protein
LNRTTLSEWVCPADP